MKKSIRNQNHLILGAAGALGYGHVKALLERGAQVTVLVRSAEWWGRVRSRVRTQ